MKVEISFSDHPQHVLTWLSDQKLSVFSQAKCWADKLTTLSLFLFVVRLKKETTLDCRPTSSPVSSAV